MTRLFVLVVTLLAAVVCVDVRADDAEDDLKALQGTWHLVYLERDGKEIKPKQSSVAVTTGNKTVVKVGDKLLFATTFTLDPTTKPKSFDSVRTDGPDKGKTFKCIYKVDATTRTICQAGSPDQPRPTEFKTKPGTGQMLAVYKRAKR